MEPSDFLARARENLDQTDGTHICIEGVNGRGEVTEDEVAGLRELLETETAELPLQKYVQEHPALLPGDREGGLDCRWVFTHPRLSIHREPDFLVSRLDSTGAQWTLIELQRPDATLFRRNGNESSQLAEGIRQIHEWREFLAEAIDHARKRKVDGGLGLPYIVADSPGLIIIGRSESRSDSARKRLGSLGRSNRTSIHSWDWLVRKAAERAKLAPSSPPAGCDCF